LIKLGMSNDPQRRRRDLATGLATRLDLLWSHPGGLSLEAFLHRRFARRRVRGEWFDFADVDAVALLRRAAADFESGSHDVAL
ncbi:GIY-YIG nuclease family protein, partial [Streptomyces roseochromogenus]|uniref:GIY-YIG nuclease family protein n=1 Tax=Streptomyces roseochromogenus TaxID=285450 RepID=UPI001ADF517B